MSSSPDPAQSRPIAPGADTARRYSTFARRIGAGVVDLFALQVLWGAQHWVRDQDPPVILWVPWYVIFRTALVSYSIALHARWGQTVGKRVFKLRLLDRSETRGPSLRQCVLRDILPVIQLPLFLGLVMPDLLHGRDPALDAERVFEIVGLRWVSSSWIVAELVTMFMGKNGRSLPDYIAGTVVVRADT